MKKILIIVFSILFWLLLGFFIFRLVTNKSNVKSTNKESNIKTNETKKEDIKNDKNDSSTSDNKDIYISSQGEQRSKEYYQLQKTMSQNQQDIYIEKGQYEQLFEVICKQNQNWNLDNSLGRKINVSNYLEDELIQQYNQEKGILADYFDNTDYKVGFISCDVYDKTFTAFASKSGEWYDSGNDIRRFKFKFEFSDKTSDNGLYKITNIYNIVDSDRDNALEYFDNNDFINIINYCYSNNKSVDWQKYVRGVDKEIFFTKYNDGHFIENIKDIYDIGGWVDNTYFDPIKQYANVKVKIYDETKNKLTWNYYKLYYDLNEHEEITDIRAKLIRKTYDTTAVEELGPNNQIIGEANEE